MADLSDSRQPLSTHKYKRMQEIKLPQIAPAADNTFVTQRAGRLLEQPKKQENTPDINIYQKNRELESIKLDLDKKRIDVVKRIEELKEVREGLKVKAIESVAIKVQIEKSTLENTRLIKEISDFSRYEAYLMTIVRLLPSNYFNSNDVTINDILLRHRTLIETNMDLVSAIEANQKKLENDIDSLGRMMKEQEDTTLILNSILGNKQKLFERMKQEKRSKAQRQEEVDRNYKEKMRMIGEIKLTIHSLFERVMVISFISNKSDALNMTKAASIGMESIEAMDHNLYSVKEKLIDLRSLSNKCLALNVGHKRLIK